MCGLERQSVPVSGVAIVGRRTLFDPHLLPVVGEAFAAIEAGHPSAGVGRDRERRLSVRASEKIL
jgi:hypothetical protein